MTSPGTPGTSPWPSAHVALELRRLCRGDLAGLFDGRTSAGIDLDSPLVVLDLFAVP